MLNIVIMSWTDEDNDQIFFLSRQTMRNIRAADNGARCLFLVSEQNTKIVEQISSKARAFCEGGKPSILLVLLKDDDEDMSLSEKMFVQIETALANLKHFVFHLYIDIPEGTDFKLNLEERSSVIGTLLSPLQGDESQN